VGVAKSSKHEDLRNVSGVQVTYGQAQILDLAARDLGVKQIAKELGVSVPTVKTNGFTERTACIVGPAPSRCGLARGVDACKSLKGARRKGPSTLSC
jgi:FixJ family two-component response regulator